MKNSRKVMRDVNHSVLTAHLKSLALILFYFILHLTSVFEVP